MSAVLLCVLLLPLVGAVASLVLAVEPRPLAGSVAAGSVIATALLLIVTMQNGALAVSLAWVPQLGLALDFRADAVGVLFALALALLTLRLVLAVPRRAPRSPAFFGAVLAFAAAADAAVLADNLLLMVACTQLSALGAYLLARLDGSADDPAIALGIRIAGALALLLCALIVGDAVGSYSRDAALSTAAIVTRQPLQPVALALLLAGTALQASSLPWRTRAAASSLVDARADLGALASAIVGIGIAARLEPLAAPRMQPLLFFAVLVAVALLVALARGATEAARHAESRR